MCNHDCFNCTHNDCICDELTLEDFEESNQRDKFINQSKPSKDYKRVKKYYESEKGKLYLKNYRQTEKYKNYQKTYNQTEKRKAYKKEYNRLYYLKKKEMLCQKKKKEMLCQS